MARSLSRQWGEPVFGTFGRLRRLYSVGIRRAFASALLVGATLAFASCTSASRAPQSAVASRSATRSCATVDAAFLQAADLPGDFQTIVDDPFSSSPFARHGLSGSASRPDISDFKSGRLWGRIATVAVNGPDRASEDAVARSYNYTVGKFPLVPLEGPVVLHNPGVLEVYQTNSEFLTVAGAKDGMYSLRGSALQAETTRATTNGVEQPPAKGFSVTLGDESVGFAQVFGTPSSINRGGIELAAVIWIRQGHYLIQLSVQGGNAINAQQGVALATLALNRLKSSCGV
jgi:hypothetical protein